MQGFDNDLLHCFNESDEKAFNEVYKLYYRSLCYFAQRFSLSREDSEDVVCSTFVALFQSVKNGKRFESLKHIKDSLFLSTRNAVINHLRSLQRQSGYMKDFINATEHSEEEARNERIEVELLQIIYHAVESLPAECRKIFKMLYLQDRSCKEVALELNLSPQTVRNQKSRAIMLLRKHILQPAAMAMTTVSISSLLLTVLLAGGLL
jgi:RNA polymerase sigma-70 factor (ECF subfamily)